MKISQLKKYAITFPIQYRKKEDRIEAVAKLKKYEAIQVTGRHWSPGEPFEFGKKIC